MLTTCQPSPIHAQPAAVRSPASSRYAMTDEQGFFVQSDEAFAEEMQGVIGASSEAEGALL